MFNHGPLKKVEDAIAELKKSMVINVPISHWEKVVPKKMAKLRDVLNEVLERELGANSETVLIRLHQAAYAIEKRGMDGYFVASEVLGSGNQNIALALVVAHQRRVFGSADKALPRETIERINDDLREAGIC